MRKILIILTASVALLFAGCQAKEETSQNTTTNNHDVNIHVNIPEDAAYTANDIEIKKHETGPEGITVYEVVLYIDSSQLSEKVLQDFFFESYYPIHEELSQYTRDNDWPAYSVYAYVIFTDMDGSPISSNIGGQTSWIGGYIDFYQYIDLDGRGLYDTTGYYTPDIETYMIDVDNKTVTYYGDYSTFTEDDKEYYEGYIVEPQ